MKATMICLLGVATLLGGCNKGDRDHNQQQAGQQASDRNAAAPGSSEVAALGLTEYELVDADILDQNGVEIAEVEELIRGENGQPEALVVEIEAVDPDRYVTVPLTGLTPVRKGNDVDLSTTMTKEQLAAQPNAPRPAQTGQSGHR